MIIKLLLPVLFMAGLIAVIGWYLSPDDLAGCGLTPSMDSRCEAADAVVAVSGGDTAARTEEAIRLYENGWGSVLFFSGAAQDKSGPSNAAVMRRMALEAGVPEEDIFIEENGRTTGQNAEKTKALLDDTISSVILVTSAYHQRRAGLEFRRSFGGIQVRDHPLGYDRQWSRWWWTSPRGWYLALGEIAKIGVFYIERVGSGVLR